MGGPLLSRLVRPRRGGGQLVAYKYVHLSFELIE
jgi:hypothetical protein